MRERHVVLRAGRGDTYRPRGAPRSMIVFSLHGEGGDPQSEIKEKHLWSRVQSAAEVGLRDVGIEPPQTALELYRISAAAYCADLRLERRGNGYDDWTRQIVLHVPVADRGLWSTQTDTLAELLGFLSGDRWRIELRESEVPAPKPKRRRRKSMESDKEPDPFDATCLFSGGLDSFVGAADLVANGRNVLLVSHLSEGIWRWVAPAQEALRDGLTETYDVRRIEHLKVTLNPPRPTENTGKEDTQRARSILFFGLGVLVAAGIGAGTPLVVPENGLISLNVPLTPGRIGSLSTRTTHPYTMDLYQRLLEGLGIEVPIELPYMFMTKGEMLASATDPEVVWKLARESVSCASPNPWGKATQSHCGYCVPCIIRRAAMDTVELDRAADYRLNILTPGRDLTAKESTHVKAFRLAVRNRAGGIRLPELLSAGRLPASMGSVDDFRSVHDRGLSEVAAFLGKAT